MFVDWGLFFIVKGELQAGLLADLDRIQSGNAESNAASGDVQYGQTATTACGGLHDVYTGEVGFFSVVSTKIKQKVPGIVAAASNLQRMLPSTKLRYRQILNEPALGTFDYGDTISIDKRFLNVHFLPSIKSI